jgi:hypothetical protein
MDFVNFIFTKVMKILHSFFSFYLENSPFQVRLIFFFFIYLFIINRVKLQLIIFLKTNFLQKIYKKQKQKRHR